MDLRRPCAALTVSLALFAAPAGAQPNGAALVGLRDFAPVDAQARRLLPNFRMPDGDLRLPGEPRRSGLIGAMEVGDGVTIGLGRFAVPEIARPRSHMESERHPANVRPRDRGIAALGISVRF
jgi:hypothetical protein